MIIETSQNNQEQEIITQEEVLIEPPKISVGKPVKHSEKKSSVSTKKEHKTKHSNLPTIALAKTKNEKLMFGAGYQQGMRDGIVGNYVVVIGGIILSIILIFWLGLL